MPENTENTLLKKAIILSLISTLLGGGVLGAIINQFFARAKTHAEANKIEAETQKTKAETTKILTELGLQTPTIAGGSRGRLKGWLKAGSDAHHYEIGVDQKETYHGALRG